MANDITNKSLRSFYEKAFEDRDAFFTHPTDDCSQVVAGSREWPGLRVLEIGCGEGDTAARLAAEGADVTAVDYTVTAIEKAKKKHLGSGVTFLCGDWEELAEGTFDVVVMQEVIEHVDKPIDVMKKISDSLNPGGELILTCPAFLNPRGYLWMTLQILFEVPMSLSDIQFITPQDMEAWSSASGFDVVEWSTFRHWQAWGSGMTGDMKKRLTNALRDAHLPNTRVDELLEWMESATAYEKPARHNGAKNYFRLRKK